ncbi:MAG: hypothetical protein NTV63_01150 [Candidatus Woesearchaeota archaeon]|nr:hypothetical protein [Candidatus Woesearchaeota archaeon]
MENEKYTAFLSESKILNDRLGVSPLFKDVSGLFLKKPDTTVYQLIEDILNQDELDEKELKIKEGIVNTIEEYSSNNKMAVQALSLKGFNITKPTSENLSSFREFDYDGMKDKFIHDYSTAHALPLFEDAEFIDPDSNRIIPYKGLYLVISVNPIAGCPDRKGLESIVRR